jgi:PAS domain S-box-containing protein
MFSRLNLLRKLRSREPIAEAAIMSSMAHAVVVLDANNRVNYLNPAAEALCGTNAAAATGQPIKKISAPLAEALQKAAGSNQVRVEYQVGEHDQIHYYEAHVSSLAGQQGQTGGWVAVINDITEQKMLSMAQAKSMRFQILFDKSPDAVVLLDPHAPDVSWPIVDCNPAFCQMNGYDRDELIGQSIDILHKKPDSPANRANFFQRLHQEGTVVGTIAHRRKDGSIYYIQYVTSLVTFEGREFVLGIDRDITERIQTEEALIQHVSRLELINQVGRDLTAELSLEFLLAKAANLIQASFGYPHVGLFLLDREREELAMKARAGSYAALFPPDHHLRLSEGINGWVARNGKRLLIGDVRKEPRYYNPFPEQLILSELSVPIKWGDEVVGVLDIQSDQLDAFGKSDILVLETLADQLAAGIQNARLFEKTQQALIELVEAEEAVRAERDRAQRHDGRHVDHRAAAAAPPLFDKTLHQRRHMRVERHVVDGVVEHVG